MARPWWLNTPCTPSSEVLPSPFFLSIQAKIQELVLRGVRRRQVLCVVSNSGELIASV